MFHHPFCIYLLFVVCMKVFKVLIDRFFSFRKIIYMHIFILFDFICFLLK